MQKNNYYEKHVCHDILVGVTQKVNYFTVADSIQIRLSFEQQTQSYVMGCGCNFKCCKLMGMSNKREQNCFLSVLIYCIIA